ncbi:C4b-binding protein beta chain-like [Amphiura filiformis]|uniref:C4b-binding protein beta chain-like n=1 Tax=Amphiura filiformis TaxID=82378 RepID=UPI003B2197F5
MNGFKYTYNDGALIAYGCNAGFILRGESVLTCTDGTYDNPLPMCELRTCADPGTPVNGFKHGTYNIYGVLIYGCNAGYKLEGEILLTCTNDGTYDNDVPTCVSVEP